MSNFPYNHSHAGIGNVFLWPSGGQPLSYDVQNPLRQILSKSNGILLDSNILLYNHCMLYENREGLKGQDAEDASTYRKIVEYLAASKAIKTNLFIHSVVVSEFASTYLRLSFRADWLRKNGKPVPPFHATVRKAYIKEEDDGKLAVRTIAKICQGILKSYKALEREDGLNTKEMGKITAKYAQGGMEFNDCIIANICHNHNLALLTNDGDFANTQGFPIVTARSSLKKNRER